MNHDITKISLIQTDLFWEQTDKNLHKFEKIFERLPLESEIVILPEMFSTGFTMNIEKLEKPVGEKAFMWLKNKSKEINKIIVGSILTGDNNNFYNRMFWMFPDGNYKYYDKRHLFHMGNEHKVITAGNKRTVVNYKGIRYLLQICYDLRFPVWSKNIFDMINNEYEYDVIIYVANWPERRKYAYMNLLKARAIENSSYVIWVNRIGSDGNNVYHSGDSQVIDSFGKVLGLAKSDKEEIVNIEISKNILNQDRDSFKVGLDWDKFSL